MSSTEAPVLQNRRAREESVEAPAEAGVSKLRRPKRHRGFEADPRTLVDVAAELGCADGSTAWLASVYWILTWIAW